MKRTGLVHVYVQADFVFIFKYWVPLMRVNRKRHKYLSLIYMIVYELVFGEMFVNFFEALGFIFVLPVDFQMLVRDEFVGDVGKPVQIILQYTLTVATWDNVLPAKHKINKQTTFSAN